MVLMNLGLIIIIDDTVLFPQIFRDYDEYKERVPFLIPCFKRKSNG